VLGPHVVTMTTATPSPLSGETYALRLDDHRTSRRELAWGVLGRTAQQLLRRERVATAYLERGWLFGPHLVLRIRAAPGQTIDLSETAEHLRTEMLSRPAGALDESAYLTESERLGELEGIAQPYGPLRKHGDVELIAVTDAGDPSDPLTMSRERLLTGWLQALAADGPDLGGDDAAWVLRAGELMLLASATHPGGIGYGAISLRSHAEAFITQFRSPDTVRERLYDVAAAPRAALRDAVISMYEGSAGPARRWQGPIAAAGGYLRALVDCGALTLELVAAQTWTTRHLLSSRLTVCCSTISIASCHCWISLRCSATPCAWPWLTSSRT
jgi:hypothetical protein